MSGLCELASGIHAIPDGVYAVQAPSGVTPTTGNPRLAPDDAQALNTDWESFGTFTIAGGSLTVRLASRPTGRVIGDAVRLERVGAAAAAAPVPNAIVRATPARAALAAARATRDVIDEPAPVL